MAKIRKAKRIAYKFPRRILMLSLPRRVVLEQGEMPAFTPYGVRKSAVRASCPDRITDAAWPYTRRIILTKRMYKNKFSEERLERMDKMIEMSNATIYTKLANCTLDLKKQDNKDIRKKKGWTETEKKKHLEYLANIAQPKRDFRPTSVSRGKWKPLEQLLPRINQICYLPELKVYRRLSQEEWYRNPVKVSPKAMKYIISDRVKKLAAPRVIPAEP